MIHYPILEMTFYDDEEEDYDTKLIWTLLFKLNQKYHERKIESLERSVTYYPFMTELKKKYRNSLTRLFSLKVKGNIDYENLKMTIRNLLEK